MPRSLPPALLPAGHGAEWRRALASISNTKAAAVQQQQRQQQEPAATKQADKQGTKRRAAAPPAGSSADEAAAAAAAGPSRSRPTSAAAAAKQRHQSAGAEAAGTSRRVAAPKPHQPHITVARRSGPAHLAAVAHVLLPHAHVHEQHAACCCILVTTLPACCCFASHPPQPASATSQPSLPPPCIPPPSSPRLHSSLRAHPPAHKTSEQLELERVEREKAEAAALRRRNAAAVKAVLAPPPPPVAHSSKPLTEPVGVELCTSKRPRLHGMETRSMVGGRRAVKGSRGGAGGRRGSGSGYRMARWVAEVLHSWPLMRMARATPAAAKCPPGAALPASLQASPYKSTAEQIAAGEGRVPAKTRLGDKGKAAAASDQQQQQQQPQAGRGHHGALTVPHSPRFATKQRVRPPRFKPREVVEAEEMAAMPKFKARPVK